MKNTLQVLKEEVGKFKDNQSVNILLLNLVEIAIEKIEFLNQKLEKSFLSELIEEIKKLKEEVAKIPKQQYIYLQSWEGPYFPQAPNIIPNQPSW